MEGTKWLKPSVRHHKRQEEAVKSQAPLRKFLSTSGQCFTPDSQACPAQGPPSPFVPVRLTPRY